MSDFSRIEFEARGLAGRATSAEVKALAKLIEQLADECQDLEKATASAAKDAKRAKRA
jgi:hypothetical protein